MKRAIRNYFSKLEKYPDYYKNEDFSKISKEIKSNFVGGIVPVERKDRTNVDLFRKEFGYELPIEIENYINMFWHPHISGYFTTTDTIILFCVLKKEGDSADDILFYENNLITMARQWAEMGDIEKYIPIGWLAYSGTYILYEVKSNKIFIEDMDIDGEVQQEPIADSLKELISNMDIVPVPEFGVE